MTRERRYATLYCMNSMLGKIVSITELRRNFGEITRNLATIDSLILTRGGEPFAILKAAPEVKMKILKKTAGSLKGTSFDNNRLWDEVFKRKSRKKQIRL